MDPADQPTLKECFQTVGPFRQAGHTPGEDGHPSVGSSVKVIAGSAILETRQAAEVGSGPFALPSQHVGLGLL